MTEIQSGKAGAESFQLIFKTYLPCAYGFFRRRGMSVQEADDLAQESLWRVYKGIDGFRWKASVHTWILQIMKNTLRNHQRHLKTASRQAESESVERLVEAYAEGEGGELPDGMTSDEPDPQDAAIVGQREQWLERALDELPPRMRQCFLLRFQGFKYREIAVMLDIQVDTVKKQLAESRRRLGTTLGAVTGLFTVFLSYLLHLGK